MHRLFVAIHPPPAMRTALMTAMGGVAHARWQTEDQLHLTLRFIGEVDRHRASDIVAALDAVHHPPFEIALEGIGQFDRKGRIDALWAGVAPHAPLKLLHNKIDQALTRIGIAPETRVYLPHLTLARFERSAGPVGDMMIQSGGVSSPAYPIDSFGLFESAPSREGSVYTIIERYALG